MPTKPQEHVFVRNDINHWQYPGLGAVDRGQVLTLKGLPGDERLLRLGYVEKLPEGAKPVQCGACEHWFLTDPLRTKHGDRVHRGRAKGEALELVTAGADDPTGRYGGAMVDVTGDREAQELAREAPLYLEHTAASQKG